MLARFGTNPIPTMNHKENEVAYMLLEEIRSSARQEPEKAKALAETYKALVLAAQIRTQTENQER